MFPEMAGMDSHVSRLQASSLAVLNFIENGNGLGKWNSAGKGHVGIIHDKRVRSFRGGKTAIFSLVVTVLAVRILRGNASQ